MVILHLKNEEKRKVRLMKNFKPYDKIMSAHFKSNKGIKNQLKGILNMSDEKVRRSLSKGSMNLLNQKRIDSLDFVRKNRKSK